MIKKFSKYNESKKYFKIKDYAINSLCDHYDFDIMGIRIKFPHYDIESETYSQWKKKVNAKIVGKLVVFAYAKGDPGEDGEYSYLIKTRIKGVTVRNPEEQDFILRTEYGDKFEPLMWFDIIDVEKYTELLKNLIGENINFYKFERKRNEGQLVTDFKLDRVYLKNDFIYFSNEDGETYDIDIFRPIIKKPVFNEFDPYGEEEWDED